MKVSERWLRDYVSVDASVDEIARTLTMAGLEVKNLQRNDELKDTIFEVEITSNRPDWLSYIGIAREVAALYDVPVVSPQIDTTIPHTNEHDFKIDIKERSLCPYYAGVIIRGIENKGSPKEVRDRLTAIGLRPINVIVDLTNIVLFELGQPMHAFDLDVLRGGKIVVRRAKDGEKFAAINHENYTLNKNDLLICDAERPVALAGVMGGVESEVSDKTCNILLESAFFDPPSIRSTARAHVISTDSSYRFERKVDLGMVRKAQERFITLLKQYTSVGSVSNVIFDGDDTVTNTVIEFDLASIPQVIGIDIDQKIVIAVLRKLGLTVNTRGNVLIVDVPSFRPDLIRPIDLMEEITRIYGYDKVPETLPPRTPQNEALESKQAAVEKIIKDLCVASGCFEVVPFTLLNEDKCGEFAHDKHKFVRIVNPQNKDLRLLRPSLVPSMLEVIALNINNGNRDLRFFEVGSRYLKGPSRELPDELKTCSIAITGSSSRTWYQQPAGYSLFDVKGIIENISNAVECNVVLEPAKADFLDERYTYKMIIDGEQCGSIGQVRSEMLERYGIDQDVFVCELCVQRLSEKAVLQRTYAEFSRFPTVRRDIAVIVDHDVLVADMEREIARHSKDLITEITVIDNFAGKHVPQGKKNVAFAMIFSAFERTLTGDEVQTAYDEIFAALKKKFKAEFRTL